MFGSYVRLHTGRFICTNGFIHSVIYSSDGGGDAHGTVQTAETVEEEEEAAEEAAEEEEEEEEEEPAAVCLCVCLVCFLTLKLSVSYR